MLPITLQPIPVSEISGYSKQYNTVFSRSGNSLERISALMPRKIKMGKSRKLASNLTL